MKRNIWLLQLIFAMLFFMGMASTSRAGIQVISPNGGETWTKGSSYDITWTVSADVQYVDIELRRGSSSYKPLASRVTASTGRLRWLITPDIATDRNYKIRIKNSSNNDKDESNNKFSIGERVAIPIDPSPTPSPAPPPDVTQVGNFQQKFPGDVLRRAELKLTFQDHRPDAIAPQKPVFRVGDTFTERLRIENHGNASAEYIYLATRRNHLYEVDRLSSNYEIRQGRYVDVPVNLTITSDHIRNGYFVDVVYLVDANATGTSMEAVRWKDANMTDNSLEVRRPVIQKQR